MSETFSLVPQVCFILLRHAGAGGPQDGSSGRLRPPFASEDRPLYGVPHRVTLKPVP